jgi:Nif-specific regulatory protein
MQQDNSSAYLIIRQGNRWTDVFRLEAGRPLIIGRASSNEIPIADERSSRRHAEVYFESGWKVRDLGSRNGTLVDGVRITEPTALFSGNVVTVASCRMTFTHSLEEVAPPLETDDPGHETTRANDVELASIVHRQSKSAILDPEKFHASEKSTKFGKPMAGGLETKRAPALELLQLAFELARETNLNRGCELAIMRLLDATGTQTAGVLRIENGQNGIQNRNVLAAIQKAGKAYHPVSDTLAANVLKDNSALLARNIHDTSLAGNRSTSASLQSSQMHSTSSVVVAPILHENNCLGLVHLYSRVGEPDLTPENLEVALAVAEVLSTFFINCDRQQSLESKLKNSRSRISELEQQLGHSDDWIGSSATMQRVRDQVQRIGPTQATVLLRGESGAGKEVVARAIHQCSTRANGPFVPLNCAALTATLLESELFGHEKGAFTGATERKLGKFEQAHTGTIMLDELGEMSMEIQAKFLRVLEGKPFERVGGSKPIQVDVRVIAATNRDLEQAVKEGQFRSDLYFRLRVIELRVPSLRERTEDILQIAAHFLEQFRARSGHGPTGFSQRAQSAMLAYHWPGNVRELRNSVERAYVLAAGLVAEPEDLALSHLEIPGVSFSQTQTDGPSSVYRERTLDDVEQEHIAATLEFTGGQKNRAAAILGIERSTLDRKLKRNKNEPG